MNRTKSFANAVAALGILIVTSGIPADARHQNDFGWGNSQQNSSNSFNSGKRRHHRHQFWNKDRSSNLGYNNYGSNQYGFNNFTGYGDRSSGLGRNGWGWGNDRFAANRVSGRLTSDSRLSNEIQNIQNNLSSGNLTSSQTSYLQDRLTRLQNQQNSTGSNGTGRFSGLGNLFHR